MTLRQLIDKVLDTGMFFSVVSTLRSHYNFDDSSEDIEYISDVYMNVLVELLNKPEFESHDRLSVDERIDDLSDPPEMYVDVHILKPDEDEPWALDFVPWSTLIDLKIVNKLKLKPEELLAHILWEITFHGYSESKVDEESKKLQELADRIDRGEEKMIPFEIDEIFKKSDE